jgi:hypothetical protein
MKPLKLILIIASAALFTACFSRTQDCPGFPEYCTDYYPYKKGDTLKFTNQYNDTLAFDVIAVTSSEGYTEDNCAKCDCMAALYGFAASSEKTDINGRITVNLNERNSLAWITWSLKFNEHSDLSFQTSMSIASLKETVIMENFNAKIRWAVVVKGDGITEFFDAENNYLWQKINEP